MDKNRTKSLSPVVVVRKKAGPKGSPTNSTQTRPRIASPVTKTAAPATPPPPPEMQRPTPQPFPAIPASIETGPSKKEREKQARRELLEVLRDRWPLAFPRDYRQLRPLAIGIRQDIAAYLPEHPPGRIGCAIRMFQQQMMSAYFRVVLQGGPRYDLEGNPRGEVTAKEQAQARRDLHAFFEQRRQNASPRAPADSESALAESLAGAEK